MPRFAAVITEVEFIEKLRAFAQSIAGDEEGDEIIDDRDIQTAQRDDLIDILMTSFCYGMSPTKVNNDIKKVQFDFENFWTPAISDYDKTGYGLQQIAGTTMLVTWGGGDWEWPVDFVVYWDGTAFRGYVPKASTWNHKRKAAFGNGYGEDMDDFKSQYPHLKSQFPKFFAEPNPDNYSRSLYEVIGPYQKTPEYRAAVIKDIEGRIQTK